MPNPQNNITPASKPSPWAGWTDDQLAREVKARMVHFYGQTDGTFAFPNSREGDLLKMVQHLLSRRQ